MLRGLASSFRTRGDRRPRQAIIGLPPASRPVMADPFIGLAGASSCARFNSCALKFDGGVESRHAVARHTAKVPTSHIRIDGTGKEFFVPGAGTSIRSSGTTGHGVRSSGLNRRSIAERLLKSYGRDVASRISARPVEANDRGSRMELADRRSLNVACDWVVIENSFFFISQTLNPLGGDTNYRRHGDGYYDPRYFVMPGLSCSVCSANCSPSDLTETPKHVSVTPIVRFQTSNEGAFLCRNLSAKNRKGPVKC